MNRKVVLLRFCYWLGAILDARAATMLTLLRFHVIPAGLSAHQLPQELGIQSLFGTGDAAALMWGWTALLLWADRNPVERRGVLLLTSVPVILLIEAHMAHAWLGGFVPFGQIAFWFLFLIGLGLLFGFSPFFVSSESKLETGNLAGRDQGQGSSIARK
jgi:hypothetical protein